MEYLFLGLAGASILALIIGLAHPALVTPGKHGPRGRALLIYGLAAAVFLILYYATAPAPPEPTAVPPDSEVPEAPERPGIPEDRPAVYSRLEISSVSQENGLIRVQGATNLPMGSILIVDFDIGEPDAEADTAVSERTAVENGRYSVDIDAPNAPEFDRGPYTVTVVFSPRIQPREVLDQVGRDGERLAGPLSHETFGFRVLEATRRVNFDLNPAHIVI